MIPDVNLTDGRKLTKEEAKNIFETEIQINEDYQIIVNEINKFDNFLEADIEFLAANELLFTDEETGFQASAIRIVLKSKKSLVNYQLSKKGENTKVDVAGGVLNEGNNKFITIMIDQGYVVNTATEYNGQLEQDFEEGLPNNEKNLKEQSDSIVEPQYDWVGCYPTFKHCGKGCGDNGSSGGGTPKNAYDVCCRTHDRCWANFGTNNCGCDCDLIKCAKKNWLDAPPPLHSALLAIFPIKDSCKC